MTTTAQGPRTFKEALVAIRPLIEGGSTWCLCYALYSVHGGQYVRRITDQLDGETNYGGWLKRHHSEWYVPFETNTSPYRHREGRLQWIDDMIRREDACEKL